MVLVELTERNKHLCFGKDYTRVGEHLRPPKCSGSVIYYCKKCDLEKAKVEFANQRDIALAYIDSYYSQIWV